MVFLEHVLYAAAILSVGVVYGDEIFFTVVGRKALSLSTDAAMTEVMGRIHEVADKRMPIFGAAGIILSLLLAITQVIDSVFTSAFVWILIALIAQVVYLILFSAVAKPIQVQLTRAALSGQFPNNSRVLQNRWGRVIPLQAGLLTLLCLILSNSY